jgi:hypothetical protein
MRAFETEQYVRLGHGARCAGPLSNDTSSPRAFATFAVAKEHLTMNRGSQRELGEIAGRFCFGSRDEGASR